MLAHVKKSMRNYILQYVGFTMHNEKVVFLQTLSKIIYQNLVQHPLNIQNTEYCNYSVKEKKKSFININKIIMYL